MADNTWLQSLKEGDKVIRSARFWDDPEVLVVESLTKTTITVGGTKYKKSDGWAAGNPSKWNRPYISKYTPELGAKIEAAELKRRLVTKIAAFNFDKLPVEKLRAIVEIMEGGE